MKIVIDGPSASGKSTLTILLAEALGLRPIIYQIHRQMVYELDAKGITPITLSSHDLEVFEWELTKEGLLRLKDKVFDERYASSELGAKCSEFFQNRFFSDYLSEEIVRRVFDKEDDIVLECRASHLIVMNADYLIYLTTPLEERARRRAQGSGTSYEEELENIRYRDEQDYTRKVKPCARPEEAYKYYDLCIDSSGETPEQTVERVVGLLQ